MHRRLGQLAFGQFFEGPLNVFHLFLQATFHFPELFQTSLVVLRVLIAAARRAGVTGASLLLPRLVKVSLVALCNFTLVFEFPRRSRQLLAILARQHRFTSLRFDVRSCRGVDQHSRAGPMSGDRRQLDRRQPERHCWEMNRQSPQSKGTCGSFHTSGAWRCHERTRRLNRPGNTRGRQFAVLGALGLLQRFM